MESRAVDSFWKAYHALPEYLRRTARKQYALWLRDPSHPSLRFKKVGKHWFARVGDGDRAVGTIDGGTVIWFFIGTHDEYKRAIAVR
jgi:hypothetical protein